MSLFSRIGSMFGGGPRASTPAADDDFWYGMAASASAAAQRVTPETALQATPVAATVNLLSCTTGLLPLILYRETRHGRERARNHPLWTVLHNAPNGWMTAFEFWRLMVIWVCLRGNAYAEIVPGRRGAVDQLLPIHPRRVTRVERVGTGRLIYTVRGPSGQPRRLTQDEMFHLRDLGDSGGAGDDEAPGLVGQSRVMTNREAIGRALAVQDYGARFFANDATPSGAIVHPGSPPKDQRDELREAWRLRQTGANRHKIAFLWGGLDFKQFSQTNEDSQFLETCRFVVAEICRIWGVQPHMLHELERSTNNNIEQQAREFVNYALGPWLKMIEQAIQRDLIVDEGMHAEFLLDSLLRGDTLTRYQAYAIALQNKVMTPNEVRQRENLNRDPDNEGYLQTPNNTGAEPGKAAPGPAREMTLGDGGPEVLMNGEVGHA
jgi:HK97 family phage portal protein